MTIPVSVQFHPSTRTSTKIMAVFTLDNGRTRTVHFGSAGASDYTQHRDPVRKQQYLARHAPREDWDNPMTAGALARWILWNKDTLHSSIQDYRRRFNLAAVLAFENRSIYIVCPTCKTRNITLPT